MFWTRSYDMIERDILSRIQKLETDNEEYSKRLSENKGELARLNKLLVNTEKKEVK